MLKSYKIIVVEVDYFCWALSHFAQHEPGRKIETYLFVSQLYRFFEAYLPGQLYSRERIGSRFCIGYRNDEDGGSIRIVRIVHDVFKL